MTTTPKHILIVEDEDAMAKVLCNKFEKSGFTTKRACNGKEAVDALSKEQFDAVLLDLVMPGKDGYSVLSECQTTMNAETAVYILTNLAQEDVMQRVAGLGAKGCFIKARTSLNQLVIAMKKELGVA